MKVEVAVLGSPSLIVRMVSLDVKQQLKKKTGCSELGSCCESGGGRPGLPSLIVFRVSLYIKQHLKKKEQKEKEKQQ